MTTNGFEPVIIGFTCNWCSYRAADMAGMARIKYAAQRAPDPPDVLRAARSAASCSRRWPRARTGC